MSKNMFDFPDQYQRYRSFVPIIATALKNTPDDCLGRKELMTAFETLSDGAHGVKVEGKLLQNLIMDVRYAYFSEISSRSKVLLRELERLLDFLEPQGD